jgi:hypothetical protein
VAKEVGCTSWWPRKEEEPPEMSHILDTVSDGVENFFRIQYGTNSKIAILFGFVTLGTFLFQNTTKQKSSGLE